MSLEFNINSIGYTPEQGGSGSITPSGTKSISENGVYDVTYFAKASVNVEGTVPTGTTTITANGTYDVTAYANASVNVEGSEPTLVTKTITANGTYAASSDNADGYSSVSVNVSSTEPTLTDLTVTPSTTSQTITPVSDGYGTVTVEAVTASIDSDIQAGNIKSGVNILGVTGTVTELVSETTTITSNGTYAPTVGNGFTSVSVDVEPTLGTKTITVNGSYTASSESLDGYSSVSVNVAGTTPTGTYTITSNGTYNVTDYATADVNVAGSGGSGVYRGNWLVPQEYIDLDTEVTRIHNSLNPTFTAGFYFNRSDNSFNTFTFNSNEIGENFKCFSANGEKTMTPNETFSYYSDVVLANNENYLIFTFDGDVSSAYFSTFFLPVNNNANKDVIFAPQRQSMKYITAIGQLNKSSDFLSPVSYQIPNLDEIHPLTNGMFVTNLNNLKNFVGFKYVPSVTEYDYSSSTYTDTNDVFKVIARLQNLPDGADFSNLTNDWNFATTLDGYPMYITFIRLNRMYVTIPKGNITFNNSVTNHNQYGINLTADNWAYIAQHAPTVSGKTIKISPYNESQLGSANKAILQSKGWTVTVI